MNMWNMLRMEVKFILHNTTNRLSTRMLIVFSFIVYFSILANPIYSISLRRRSSTYYDEEKLSEKKLFKIYFCCQKLPLTPTTTRGEQNLIFLNCFLYFLSDSWALWWKKFFISLQKKIVACQKTTNFKCTCHSVSNL